MARVTVEDCVTKVRNRFELVLLAAQRARDIHSGAELTVDRDNDKDAVVALREIADEQIELNQLRHELGSGRQFLIDDVEDDLQEENPAMIAAEQAWAGVTSAQEADASSPANNSVLEKQDASTDLMGDIKQEEQTNLTDLYKDTDR